jgi:hypothetical protein
VESCNLHSVACTAFAHCSCCFILLLFVFLCQAGLDQESHSDLSSDDGFGEEDAKRVSERENQNAKPPCSAHLAPETDPLVSIQVTVMSESQALAGNAQSVESLTDSSAVDVSWLSDKTTDVEVTVAPGELLMCLEFLFCVTCQETDPSRCE